MTHHYEVNADSIVQTLFVNNVAHGEFSVAHEIATIEAVAKLRFNHTDIVPTLGHGFLPSCDFTSEAVVFG